jgi:hypothetical protein
MPVKTVVGGRPVVHFLLLVAAVAGLLLLVGVFDAAFAQGSPFGAPRGQAPAVPVGGVLGWIFAPASSARPRPTAMLPGACSDCRSSMGFFTPPDPATARR